MHLLVEEAGSFLRVDLGGEPLGDERGLDELLRYIMPTKSYWSLLAATLTIMLIEVL